MKPLLFIIPGGDRQKKQSADSENPQCHKIAFSQQISGVQTMVINCLSQVNNSQDEYGGTYMTTVFIQAEKRGGYAGRGPIIKTNPNRKKADRAAVLIRINRGDSSSGKTQTKEIKKIIPTALRMMTSRGFRYKRETPMRTSINTPISKNREDSGMYTPKTAQARATTRIVTTFSFAG